MNTAARKKASSHASPSPTAKKEKRTGSLRREVSGVLFFALSLYALTCVTLSEGAGALGLIIRNTLLGLFGPVGAFVIPALLTVIFFFGRRLRKGKVLGRKITFAVIASLTLVAAIQLIFEGIPQAPNAVDTVGDLWVNAKEGNGGGVIGGLLALGLSKAMGKIIATAVLLLLSCLTLSFTLGFSAWGVWATVGELLCIERAPKKIKEKRKKGEAEKIDPAEALKEYFPDRPIRYTESVAAPSSEDDAKHEDTDSDFLEAPPVSYHDTDYPPEPEKETEYSYSDSITPASPDGYVTKTSYPAYDDPTDYGTADETEKSEEPPKPDKTPDPIPTETVEETDDYDETDDRDPFDAPPSRTRKFGKLIGKKAPKTFSNVINELENTPPPPPAPEKEPESEENNVKKWTTGDKYAYPSTSLLNPPPEKKTVSEEEVREVADKILRKLASFKVKANLVGYSIGPSITRYELTPGEGVRVSKISQLITDISLELAADGVRIEAPIPGKAAIGIEVPNKTVSLVSFRALAENSLFTKAKSKITVCIGQNVTGDPVFMDIDDMPHVLIAGQTKSGKSVAINCMILSLLYRVSPDEVKLILIDPKRVEFNIYSRLPHLVMPVIDDPTQAAAALSWAVKEMERRYELMKNYDARNREEYLENTADIPDRDAFPQIVIIIDELADLMLQVREHVEPLINRIAAKARACGMHLLVGTQRPSTDVVTGLIKANIPARISFKVADQVDARIIGTAGAEKLLGKGDMLYHPTGGAKVRVQGSYVGGSEILRVIDYIVENNGEASYDPEVLSQLEEEANSMLRVKKRGGGGGDDDGGLKDKKIDPLLMNAIEIAVENQSISTSSLQRYLEVGYGRGAKLIDSMERLGIVGPPNGSKPREVLMTMEQYHLWRLEQNFD